MKLKPIIWEGCYDSSWKGVITDASFQHPAKFARGLIERIFDHCLERGYLQKGDYVKDKKRVPLCDDTARLIEHIGFTVIERIHAMLVKETRHDDFFEGETVETKSKKSFFRRLTEAKGSPPIDYEQVLIARRNP